MKHAAARPCLPQVQGVLLRTEVERDEHAGALVLSHVSVDILLPRISDA